MGCQLIGPEAVSISSDGGSLAAIVCGQGSDGLLFVHDLSDDASSDSWGLLPESFASIGYRSLSIDLPGYGGSLDTSGSCRSAVTSTVAWLRSHGVERLFVCAAGDSVAFVPDADPRAAVLVAPLPTDDLASRLGAMPKLIIGGIADSADRERLEQFHAACRGWSPFTSFATVNTAQALLDDRHGLQVRTQIAAFLQEFRKPNSASIPVRRS